MISHPISLLNKATNEFVDAELVENIDSSHLQSVEKDWMPALIHRLKELLDQGKPLPENWHWNWREKMARIQGILAFRTFAVVCEGKTQGLMQLNTAVPCKLSENAGKELAYIDYVESAPWNRASIVTQPRFGLVGSVLVRAAIEVSRDEGFHGRIGLHSLPQSEVFYAQACGMTDLGIDSAKENLRYFEMTSEQAASFSS